MIICRADIHIPIIFATGYGDILTATLLFSEWLRPGRSLRIHHSQSHGLHSDDANRIRVRGHYTAAFFPAILLSPLKGGVGPGQLSVVLSILSITHIKADLLNLTHDSVFVRDMRDMITYWNRGAQELYG